MHTYRRDIDGLRALAILPVVLFHFRVPGFAGGFTGVDVFFVISGFLITGVVNRELASNSFTFRKFYERRARRLFPALYTMLFCCVPIAAWCLLPTDFGRFTRALGAAAVFGANVYFWRTTGYFDAPAEHQPLLHTWSLAVEEQFYFLFPPVILIVHRWLPRRLLPPLIIAGVLASFAASAAMQPTRSAAVFYLPMFRAWELLMGAAVAEGFLPSVRSRPFAQVLAAAGFLAIVASAFGMSEASATPHPVPAYACMGAALVLYAGRDQITWVGRLLSLRGLVFVGLISYSLYLWHWPVWVFAKYFLIRPPTTLEAAGLLGLSLALAVASWRFVERPFRGERGVGSQRQVLVGSVAIAAAMCVAAITVLPRLGRAVTPAVSEAASVERETGRFHKCDGLSRARTQGCRIGHGTPTFALWGDSHAMAMGDGIEEIARRAQRSGVAFTRASCGPLVGVSSFDREYTDCAAFNRSVMDAIGRIQTLDTVVLASRWVISAVGIRYRDESGQPKIISADGLPGNLSAFRAGLDRTLRFLNEAKLRVVILGPVPEIGWDVPSVLARSAMFGRPPPHAPTMEDYEARQDPVFRVFDDLRKTHSFEVVPVAHLFCGTGQCRVQHEGKPLYRDDDHLASEGAKVLSNLEIFATHRRGGTP